MRIVMLQGAVAQDELEIAESQVLDRLRDDRRILLVPPGGLSAELEAIAAKHPNAYVVILKMAGCPEEGVPPTVAEALSVARVSTTWLVARESPVAGSGSAGQPGGPVWLDVSNPKGAKDASAIRQRGMAVLAQLILQMDDGEWDELSRWLARNHPVSLSYLLWYGPSMLEAARCASGSWEAFIAAQSSSPSALDLAPDVGVALPDLLGSADQAVAPPVPRGLNELWCSEFDPAERAESWSQSMMGPVDEAAGAPGVKNALQAFTAKENQAGERSGAEFLSQVFSRLAGGSATLAQVVAASRDWLQTIDGELSREVESDVGGELLRKRLVSRFFAGLVALKDAGLAFRIWAKGKWRRLGVAVACGALLGALGAVLAGALGALPHLAGAGVVIALALALGLERRKRRRLLDGIRHCERSLQDAWKQGYAEERRRILEAVAQIAGRQVRNRRLTVLQGAVRNLAPRLEQMAGVLREANLGDNGEQVLITDPLRQFALADERPHQVGLERAPESVDRAAMEAWRAATFRGADTNPRHVMEVAARLRATWFDVLAKYREALKKPVELTRHITDNLTMARLRAAALGPCPQERASAGRVYLLAGAAAAETAQIPGQQAIVSTLVDKVAALAFLPSGDAL